MHDVCYNAQIIGKKSSLFCSQCIIVFIFYFFFLIFSLLLSRSLFSFLSSLFSFSYSPVFLSFPPSLFLSLTLSFFFASNFDVVKELHRRCFMRPFQRRRRKLSLFCSLICATTKALSFFFLFLRFLSYIFLSFAFFSSRDFLLFVPFSLSLSLIFLLSLSSLSLFSLFYMAKSFFGDGKVIASIIILFVAWETAWFLSRICRK